MNKNFFLPAILLLMLTLPGCELIGDIFMGGFYIGIVVVVIIVILIIWLLSKLRGRR